jgi:hypothetical protein
MFAPLVLFAVLAVATAHMNPFLPKEWHDYKVSANSTAAVTSYLITSIFYKSNVCSTEAESVSGIGFGACVVGTDACGNAVSAMNYVYTKQANGYVYYTYNSFKGDDCTTTPIASYPMQSPLGCLNGGTVGYKYDYVEGQAAVNSWKGRNKGIVSEIFYSNDCTSNPAMWSSVSFSYCFPMGGTCENPAATGYAKYSSCSGSGTTLDYFSDAACSSKTKSADLPQVSCVNSPPLTTYTSSVCNA